MGRGHEQEGDMSGGRTLFPPTVGQTFGSGSLKRTLGEAQKLDSKPQPLPHFH